MPVMSSGLLGELSSLAVHVALPDVLSYSQSYCEGTLE